MRTRWSIRTQMILALNAVAVVSAVLVGWQSAVLVSRAIEKRLVEDAGANAARLISQMRLPVSDRLMQQLSQVLNCEVCAVSGTGSQLLASSLTPPAANGLREALPALPVNAPRVVVAGVAYRVGAAPLTGSDTAASGPPPPRLLVLMPESRLRAARRTAAWQIAKLTIVSLLIATVTATWLGGALSRPLCRLADRMGHLATSPDAAAAELGAATAPAGPPLLGAAAETQQLAEAFEGLLGRLRAAQEQLAQAARLAAAGQLSAAVAHELRNPLSGVKMNGRVLLDEPGLSAEARHSIELILREIDRMDRYLQELMNLQPQPEQPTLERRPVALASLVESVVAACGNRATHAGVALTCRCEAPGGWVAGDEDQLRQVLLNLVTNALDVVTSGGRVAVTVAAVAGGKVRLSVTDTGPGVDPALGERIFEPFVTTKLGGAGLGLYLCRQLVVRHGGQLGYCNHAPGAEFWVELPAVEQP